MRERPIILTDWQVRAVVAGTKTQHRVVMRPQPLEYTPGIIDITKPCQWDIADGSDGVPGEWGQCRTYWEWHGSVYEPEREVWRPLKNQPRPGDRLWVRETWARNHDMPTGTPWGAVYHADPGHDYDVERWSPSTHMPRWASRITLTVLGVRAERLQDISEADAVAEGAPPLLVPPDGGSAPHVQGFCDAWPGKGPASWDANPWVWRITFKKENGDA